METLKPPFHHELGTVGRGRVRVRACAGESYRHGIEVLTKDGFVFLGYSGSASESERAAKVLREAFEDAILCERSFNRKARMENGA